MKCVKTGDQYCEYETLEAEDWRKRESDRIHQKYCNDIVTCEGKWLQGYEAAVKHIKGLPWYKKIIALFIEQW